LKGFVNLALVPTPSVSPLAPLISPATAVSANVTMFNLPMKFPSPAVIAKESSDARAIPCGSSNAALVPIPRVLTAAPLPASVVLTFVDTMIFRIRLLPESARIM
jgi:hypothetical protein